MKRLVLLGLILAACGEAEDAPQHMPLKELVVEHEGKVEALKVQVADDDHEREKGLMFRTTMPQDEGMLFVWPEAEPRSFWMHNTPLALDIIYVRNGKIVNVIPWAKPFDETSLPSEEPADSVLEVNGGWVTARGVEVGDVVRFK